MWGRHALEDYRALGWDELARLGDAAIDARVDELCRALSAARIADGAISAEQYKSVEELLECVCGTASTASPAFLARVAPCILQAIVGNHRNYFDMDGFYEPRVRLAFLEAYAGAGDERRADTLLRIASDKCDEDALELDPVSGSKLELLYCGVPWSPRPPAAIHPRRRADYFALRMHSAYVRLFSMERHCMAQLVGGSGHGRMTFDCAMRIKALWAQYFPGEYRHFRQEVEDRPLTRKEGDTLRRLEKIQRAIAHLAEARKAARAATRAATVCDSAACEAALDHSESEA